MIRTGQPASTGTESAKVSQVVREWDAAIPWGHHVNLLANIAVVRALPCPVAA